MQLPVNKPVIVLLGASGVGKTELSIALAKKVNGEIVSVDSRYIYMGIDIGTAKPDKKQRQAVPHHLIDIAEPDEIITLAQFQKMAYKEIDSILQAGNIPFLVGGTGQYLWGVIEGWQPPTIKPNVKLRHVLETMAEQSGAESLYHMVEVLDPLAACFIEPRNVRRSIRALEVIFSSGELFSKQKKYYPPPYRFKIIGLQRARDDLYRRVDARIDKMFADGLIQETEKLLSAGYNPNLPSMTAIGYKEVCDYLQKKCTLEEAIALIKKRTRIFIRHQANWFKKDDARIRWFAMDEEVEEKILGYIYLEEGWI